MKVAMYDRLDGLDDLALYRQHADVVACNRYRPWTKVAPDADLVLVTYTNPPYTELPVVLCGSSTQPVRGLPLVYRAPHWSRHAVAAWCLAPVLTFADRDRPVVVLGVGRISRLVWRWLRRYWPAGVADTSRRAGALIDLTPDTVERGAVDHQVLTMRDAVLVSAANGPSLTWDVIDWALDGGALRQAVIDTAPRWRERPGLVLTPHVAYRGHHSARRRQAAIVAAITRPLDLRRLRP